MHTPRFFWDHTLTVGNDMILPGDVTHHLLHVLRMKEGDDITLFNGDGSEYRGTIASIDRSKVAVAISASESISRESELTSRLGLGILKRHAMESALTRATELGVSEITPLITSRTNVRNPRGIHWQQVIQSSCEQCGRNRLPVLQEIIPIEDWLAKTESAIKIVANPLSERVLNDLQSDTPSVSMLVGPEGGLSGQEIEGAEAEGFLSITLGKRVLRAETAPAALMSLVQYRWGDINQ
tara:strand:- start:465 stop:1181 length:717 start_codon:yes stop_codon:yes gene_type:complete